MLVHHFLICKLPNIPSFASIKSILWSVLVLCPDESCRKDFDVVIIKDLSTLPLQAELCESLIWGLSYDFVVSIEGPCVAKGVV